MIKLWESRARAPETQPDHVGHVLRLGGTCCRGIDNSRLWQLILEFQHCQTSLGGLRLTRGAQVLSSVTLVEDNLMGDKNNR